MSAFTLGRVRGGEWGTGGVRMEGYLKVEAKSARSFLYLKYICEAREIYEK